MPRRPKKYSIPKDTTLIGKEKAVIYTRVSSPSQVKEGDGLQGQERLCRERAEQNNVEIVGVYTDGGTKGDYANSQTRDGLNAMIEFLKEQNKEFTKIHFVIVDDMDRVIRDVQGRWEIKARIEQLGGAKIYALKQKIEDTPEGKMIQSITMSVKQYQRESNARQAGDRQRARMLNGYRPLYSPAGYTHKQTKTEGKILVLSDEAPLIKESLVLFSEGFLSNQTAILEFLNSKGFRTRQGKPVNPSFVEELLKKERLLKYAGYIHYENWNINMVQGKHEKLFGLDVVEKILDRLNPRTFYVKSSASEIGKQVPLRGFLYDTTTGIKYTGGPSEGKNETYIYYTCRIPQENGKKKSINLLNTRLHKEFETYLQQFKIDETILILFDEIMKEIWSKKDFLKNELVKDLYQRIDEIDKEIKKLMGLLRKSKNEKMIENYENEIIDLEEEKEAVQLKIDSKEVQEPINIEEIISNTKAILRNPSFIRDLGDSQLQKMLIGVLFNEKIFYDKKSGFQTPEIPLIYTHLSSSTHNNSGLVEMIGIEPMSERDNDDFLPLELLY